MSVIVQAVREDGIASEKKIHVCFGFAYSGEKWKEKFGERFSVQKCKYIRYFPKNNVGDKVLGTYLKALVRVGVLDINGISLVSPEKGISSVYTYGIQADINIVSGQEWVGIFELFRAADNSGLYLEWVVHFNKKVGLPLGASMVLARSLHLPPISTFDEVNVDYTVGFDTCPSPESDILPNVYHRALMQRVDYLGSTRFKRFFKPYKQAPDFYGVYLFFCEDLAYVGNKSLKYLSFEDAIRFKAGLKTKLQCINEYTDLEDHGTYTYRLLQVVLNDRMMFRSLEEVATFVNRIMGKVS